MGIRRNILPAIKEGIKKKLKPMCIIDKKPNTSFDIRDISLYTLELSRQIEDN